MQIEIRAHNTRYDNGLHTRAERHFGKLDKLVSPLASIHLDLHEEANPAVAYPCEATATLQTKGAILHASARATDMGQAVEEVAVKMRRQVQRYLAKHKHRTERHKRLALPDTVPDISQ